MNPNPQHPNPPDNDTLEAFLTHRRRLFGIAYRVLGSSFDAEDVVQETWIRWQRCDRTRVRDAGAFLATTTTRLAINVLTSARYRRETYPGPWLPEPVDTSNDPTLGAEHGEALEYAVLLLMERLTATERAAYVLREAFAYPYPRIAEILQSSEAHSRQLVCRARRHLSADGGRSASRRPQRRRLLTALLDAAHGRGATALEELLSGDVRGHPEDGRVAPRSAREGSDSIQSITRFPVLDSPREPNSRSPRRVVG